MPVETIPDTEGAMRTWLRAQSNITALVGNRVFLGGIPQQTAFPLIVLHQIGGADDESEAPVDNAVITFQCWAATKASASAVTRALRASLQSIRGATDLDANTRCFGAFVDLTLWQPDPSATINNARYIVTARVTAIALT
jgi:hypothetical protein